MGPRGTCAAVLGGHIAMRAHHRGAVDWREAGQSGIPVRQRARQAKVLRIAPCLSARAHN